MAETPATADSQPPATATAVADPKPPAPEGDKGQATDAPQSYWIGGAQTFAEWDSWVEAAEQTEEIDALQGVFLTLVSNITDDFELSPAEQARRVAAAANELADRVEGSGDEETDEQAGERSWRRPSTWGVKVLTKTVSGVKLSRSAFADQGDAGKTSTWKMPLFTSAGGSPDLARVSAAIQSVSAAGFRGRRTQLTDSRATVKGRIRSAIDELKVSTGRKAKLRERLSAAKELAEDPGGIAVFKDSAGKSRWFTVHSNSYFDNEGEVFPLAAHKAYMAWVDEAPADRMPELRFWHIPTAGLGRADWMDLWEEGGVGFMCASGTFYDGMEGVAAKLAATKDYACSHGYTYLKADLRDGEYAAYRDFEISVLPLKHAANELTAFAVGDQEEIPMLSDTKRKALIELVGSEQAGVYEKGISELKSRADESGIGFREIIDAVLDEEKPDGGTPPATPAVPAAAATATPAASATATEPTPPTPEGEKSIGDQVAAALKPVTDAIGKLATDIEANKAATAALKDTWTPRNAPAGLPASASPETVADGRTAAVKAAKEGAAEASAAVDGLPDHMRFYFGQGESQESALPKPEPEPVAEPAKA